MNDSAKSFLAATLAFFAVTYLGVRFAFGPAMGMEYASDAMFNQEITALLGSLISIAFFVYAIGMVGDVDKTARVIALSQIVLVDVYYVINGERGITAAAMSAVILLVGWTLAGKAYSHFSGGESSESSSTAAAEEPDPNPYSPPVENATESDSSSFPY